MGGAIWAMYFIAMLARQMEVEVTYEIDLTAISALIGMVACMVGLAIAGTGVFTWTKLVAGGAFMGVGVAGVHYTGMYAAQFVPTGADTAAATAGGISGPCLGATIFAVTTVLLATVLVTSLLREQRRAMVRI